MNRSGQSTVEYILMYAAVIFVIFLAVKPGGIMSVRVKDSLDKSVNTVSKMATNTCFKDYDC